MANFRGRQKTLYREYGITVKMITFSIVSLYAYLLTKFSFIDDEFFIVFGLLTFLFIASFKAKSYIRNQYFENIVLLSGNILEFVRAVVFFLSN